MKPKLTRAQLKTIATAIDARWRGEKLCVADWVSVLQSAAFEGFDVARNLAEINALLPEDMKPIELIPLAEQQRIYDEIDRYIPGGNRRAWFENQRRLVQAALAKVEQPYTVTQR
jgi:hypothetical protein